ncbi:MAG: transposase, partial [Bacteroidetes bacterium]
MTNQKIAHIIVKPYVYKALREGLKTHDTGKIQNLRGFDSVHHQGRRPKILSDNGSCYISEDIKDFMKEKGITQVHGAPNHPQTQG